MKAANKEKAMAKMERRLAPGMKPAAYATSEEKPISRKTGRGRTGNGKTQEKKTGKEAVRETLAARKKIYVRYKEGAALYSMGLSKFQQMAHAAGAVYKADKACFVNLEIFDAYFQTFRLDEGCRTDFADIQNKKECGGNRQWQNHYLRNWAANTKGKGII